MRGLSAQFFIAPAMKNHFAFQQSVRTKSLLLLRTANLPSDHPNLFSEPNINEKRAFAFPQTLSSHNKKKGDLLLQISLFGFRQLPILPGRFQPSAFRGLECYLNCLGFHNPPGPAPRKQKKSDILSNIALLDSGNYLSSRAVSSQVLSAFRGLTSVFGMGTGGTL